MSRSRITKVLIMPVAFQDPPLLNVVGVHQPYALRAIIQIHTDSGSVGLGETYADDAHLARLGAVGKRLEGLDVFDLNGLRRRVIDVLNEGTGGGGARIEGFSAYSSSAQR